MINLAEVSVALIAVTAQFKTQNHAFSPILVPNYNLSETVRDLTRISLQFLSNSQARLLVSSFYLSSFYPVVWLTLQRPQTFDTRMYRPLRKGDLATNL